MKLFRAEALRSRRAKLAGSVILVTPLAGVVVWSIIGLIGLAVLTALYLVQVPSRFRVYGGLTTSGGVIELHPRREGVISAILVQEGATVPAGAPLIKISSEQLDAGGKSVTSALQEAHAETVMDVGRQRSLINARYEVDRAAIGQKRALAEAELLHDLEKEKILARRSDLNASLEDAQRTLAARGYGSSIALRMREDASLAAAQDQADLRFKIAQDRAAIEAAARESRALALRRDADLAALAEREAMLQRDGAELHAMSGNVLASPVAGRVGRLTANVGDTVGQSSNLGTLITDEGRLEAVLQVPNSVARSLKVGAPAQLAIRAFPAGRYGTFSGRIVSISREASVPNPTTSPYREPVLLARASLDWRSNSRINKAALRPGMEVDADMEGDKRSLFKILMGRT